MKIYGQHIFYNIIYMYVCLIHILCTYYRCVRYIHDKINNMHNLKRVKNVLFFCGRIFFEKDIEGGGR